MMLRYSITEPTRRKRGESGLGSWQAA